MQALEKISDENKVDISFSSPLSPAQKRMWFLEKVKARKTAYNVTISMKLIGDLNVELLKKSYNALLKKHLILTAYFTDKKETLKMYFHDNVSVEIESFNLENISSQNEELKEIFTKQAQLEFDLEKPPLMNLKLVHLKKNEFILINTFHHIIIDGWSLGIFYKDLSMFYNVQCENLEINSSCHEISYIDYINDEISKEGLPIPERQVDFWKEYLENFEYAEIHENNNVENTNEVKGKIKIIEFSEDRAKALEEIARENDVTLYTVLLSLYGIIYSYYSGKNNFVIGSPVANRLKLEYEDIIGLFVNTLPIKIELDFKDSVKNIINKVSSSVIKAFEHQELPFNEIVNLTGFSGDLDKNPIFQTMFVLQESIFKDFNLNNIKMQEVNPEMSTVRFDIESNFWRTGAGLKWRIIYNSDLYNESLINNMSGQLVKLIDSFIANQDLCLDKHNLLNSSEMIDLMRFSQGERITKNNENISNIIEAIEQSAKNYPKKIALKDKSGSISYEDLIYSCVQYKEYLKKTFPYLKKGAIISVTFDMSIELVIAMISIMSLRYTLLPINPDDPKARKKYILENSNTSLIISEKVDDDLIVGLNIQYANLPRIINKSYEENIKLFSSKIHENDIAYIIYTSGTTGNPKGVKVSHGNIFHTLMSANSSFKFKEEDIFGCFALFSFDIFYFECFSLLLCGGETRLVSKEELLNPDTIIPILFNITCMQAVPSLMRQFLSIFEENKINTIPNLRQVTTGGEIVHPNLFNKLCEIFINAEVSVTYGPTETTIICSKYLGKNLLRSLIGKPLPDVEIKIYSPSGKLSPMYVPGEIYIAGNGVSMGYLNQPILNEEKFVEINSKKFYRTGDIGRWMPEGNIEYLGRTDDQIKLRGFRIELDAITSSIVSYENVSQACTLLHTDVQGNKKIISYVKLSDGVNKEDLYNKAALKRVEQWQALFDETHVVSDTDDVNHRDFTGWKSAISGEDLPRKEMEEWLSGTIKLILDHANKSKLKSKELEILEVGCGTGLLVFELYQYCKNYDASDFSLSVIKSLEEKLKYKNIGNVNLYQSFAHDVKLKTENKYDLIVLNSVIQYFPSIDYLKTVISNLESCLNPGGLIFIGDVRDYRKLDLLNFAIIENNPMRFVSKNNEELLSTIINKRASEKELCISPSFFTENLKDFSVNIWPRIDDINNELTRYRYNVILKKEKGTVSSKSFNWECCFEKDISPEKWIQDIKEKGYFAVKNVWDSRVNKDIEKYLSFSSGNGDVDNYLILSSVENFSILDLARFSEKNGFRFDVKHSEKYINCYDVIIRGGDFEQNILWEEPSILFGLKNISTYPIKIHVNKNYESDIKRYLGDKLPNYMVPSHIRVLDNMPLTSHGKIDKKKLYSEEEIEVVEVLPITLTPTEKSLIQSVCELLNIGHANSSDNFFDIGGNSLLAIQWSIELRRFNMVIKPQVIFKHPIISELAAYIDRKTHAKPTVNAFSFSKQKNASSKYSHIDLIAKKNGIFESVLPAETTLLLLGATGYLGCHVLKELLKRETHKIICLVRGGREYLENIYHFYFYESLPASVEVMAGDISQNELGFSSDVWKQLSEKVNVIVNCAANVRHVAHSNEIYPTNTKGVEELIKFAKVGCKKYFYQTSTIGVKGVSLDPNLSFSENDLDIEQEHTEDYSISKFQAEKLLVDYMKEGGKVRIFRIGTIAPHSSYGYFQKNIQEHFFSRFMQSIVSCGLAPDWSARMLALTPVDNLAAALIDVLYGDFSDRAVYHLITPHEISYAHVANLLKGYGYKIDIVSSDMFLYKINEAIQNNISSENFTGIIQLIDSNEYKHVSLDTRITSEALKNIGFQYCHYSDEYMYKFINYSIKTGFIPGPNEAERIRIFKNITENSKRITEGAN